MKKFLSEKHETSDATATRVLICVLLGSFTVSLNNSALNLAIPTLMRTFDAGVVQVSWVMTLFLICMGMTMPATGFLAGRFGNKRIYLIGLWLFVAGSLAGAASPSLIMVILSRGIQGVAGGLMIPLSLPLIFASYERGQRGRITGIWGFAVMIAPALGPSVGGLILDVSHWQVLFLMNLPTAAMGLLCGHRYLVCGTTNAHRRFDIRGLVLATLGVGGVLFALGTITSITDLLSVRHLLPLTLGAAALAIFVYTELRMAEPLLNLRIFAVKTYGLSVVIVCVQALGTFGCLLLIPLWMQHVQGYDALTVGLVFLPAALAAALCVIWAGRQIDGGSPRWVLVVGLLLTATSMLGFANIDERSPLWLLFALMSLRGVGLGCSYLPVTTIGLNAVPNSQVAEASAMNNLSRRLTSSLGVVAIAIFYDMRTTQLAAGGLNHLQASIDAINEGFVALAILILAVTPLAFLLSGSSIEARQRQGQSQPMQHRDSTTRL